MKIKLLLALFAFFVCLSNGYASFPVKRTVKTSNVTSQTSITANSSIEITPIVSKAAKDKWVGVALWFFLGVFAGHRWYYG